MVVDARTADLIEATLRESLISQGYLGATVETWRDYDGEPALSIVARLDPPGRVPPSEVTTGAMVALSNALLAIGDPRVPYLDYVFPEQPIEDEAA